MSQQHSCFRCGSSNCVAGEMQSTGQVRFRASRAKFFSFTTADVPVEALMCLECGAIAMIGDLERARKLHAVKEPAAQR